jgi:hypothetical protein
MIAVYGAEAKENWKEKTGAQRQTIPMPLYQPQISHVLFWDWIHTSPVRSRGLRSWVTGWPSVRVFASCISTMHQGNRRSLRRLYLLPQWRLQSSGERSELAVAMATKRGTKTIGKWLGTIRLSCSLLYWCQHQIEQVPQLSRIFLATVSEFFLCLFVITKETVTQASVIVYWSVFALCSKGGLLYLMISHSFPTHYSLIIWRHIVWITDNVVKYKLNNDKSRY